MDNLKSKLLSSISDKLPRQEIALIKRALSKLTDSQLEEVQNEAIKDNLYTEYSGNVFVCPPPSDLNELVAVATDSATEAAKLIGCTMEHIAFYGTRHHSTHLNMHPKYIQPSELDLAIKAANNPQKVVS
jgi:hypothetical protein